MFWNKIEVIVTEHCECATFHFIVHLKLVNFLFYLFHFKLFIREKRGSWSQLCGESEICVKT